MAASGMTPSQAYAQGLAEGRWQADPAQQELLPELDALQAARQLPVQQMISIAPPVGFRDFTGVLPPACPWLLIQGEQDEVVDAAAVLAWAAKQNPAPTIVRMPETGLFFHRRLLDLRGAIKNGVRKNLPPPMPA